MHEAANVAGSMHHLLTSIDIVSGGRVRLVLALFHPLSSVKHAVY